MYRTTFPARRIRQALAAVGLLATAAFLPLFARTSAEAARVLPAPALDTAPGGATSQVAVFAGGCFWGVQGIFQHVNGVTSAVSGYAGGEKKTARYEIVSAGRSGHAEAVKVTFDPAKISYGQLLQIFFSVAHDPTELDRQGPDVGSQYRSAVFPVTGGQAHVAKAYIAQLDQARAFNAPIVTKIEPEMQFHPAEDYHQDYATRHPSNPYIMSYDLPKIQSLKLVFPLVWRATPVLVAASR
ncbi:MAG: peptide-methionine (S)-S-oxide reductase [Acetobacteraceae bacterium]|nr:peptide-methionine (S)-S-oxide reductase [Acetobacteraceae bacterium]